ncbi:MAG: M13 family peptidase [Sphingomonas sp.]|uniref:M13 family metallopeptidase n=1 Tax=Sphingomonas sp. CD22 TaxID=3100214 RepID=UPI001210B809|nr:M13-type metalloendopeptidase [Sphingomonas sp. CD22]MEA1084525.1 M13-type metalloendopeptidase [Sphingomonas sp. CD22]RZL59954.1 MAG: M13 family peptidase [Sphingomonas sp.]
MRKQVLAAILLASAASGAVYAQTNARSATAPVATDGKPKLGDFGVDLTAMDRKIAPGDDFYNYINGAWMARTEIPADKASWGGFGILRDLSDTRTKAVIEGAAASPSSDPVAAKIGDTYATFMDAATIEAAGAAPLKPYLAKIAAIRSQSDLAKAFGEATMHGIDVPVGAGVEQDLKDNTVYAVYLGQGGLGLPDRDYYLKDDAKFAEARTKYVTYIADMLRMAGQPDPQGSAQRIYDLEKQIAQVHWERAELRQVEKGYNPAQVADLATSMPGFDWKAMLAAQGLGAQTRVIVGQPSALTGTAKIIAATPLPVWKEYLAFHTISNAAPLLSSNFVNTQFAFFGTTLNGTPQLKERWKRGVDLVNGSLGEAVGQIYVQKYFPPEAKAKADELVHNLIVAMDARLAKLEWMAPETKVKARAKLAAFTPKIGYPDKFRDYTALRVVKGDVLGNADRVAEFEYNRQLNKIGKPVDRSEWFMTPQTVNAYANPLMNEVVFPAAILQPPFFDPNADPAVNYGAIGAVIGHELSHHFDDQGRKFDPKGNFADWWTPADVQRFTALTDKVVAQYGAYEPIAGSHVNGKLTLGENMADLAGINVAYDAYKLSLKGKKPPVLDGFTGDQRFFMGFGQVWQTKAREASIKNQLTTDPHTPGQWRAYVVRNLDAWYPAFDVKPGQKYYLAPADRIKIW